MFEGLEVGNTIITLVFGGAVLAAVFLILWFQLRQVNETKIPLPDDKEGLIIYQELVRSKVKRFLVYTIWPIFILTSVWIVLWWGERAGYEILKDAAIFVAGIYIGSRLLKSKE